MIPWHDNLHEQLLPRLRAWKKHNVHIGLVPRMSPAWSGMLYREPHGALTSYAEMFDTGLLCIGPRYHPDTAAIARLQQKTHEDFGWTVVLEDDHMVYRFPYGHSDRRKRGECNPHFLSADRIKETLFPLLRHLEHPVRMVVLNVGPVYRTEMLGAGGFLRMLGRCLDTLPATYRYAVATANSEFVLPDYLECLRQRNVVHVLSGASLLDVICRPGVLTADICMLRSSCMVAKEEGEEWSGFRETVRCCLEKDTPLYAYLSDGSEEGGTPLQHGEGAIRLVQLLAGLDAELARRSPVRRKAA